MSDYSIKGSSNRPISLSLDFPASESKVPLVIFLHGFKGFKDWGHWPLLGKELSHKGFAVLRMNFSHNGTTPESPFDFVDLESFLLFFLVFKPRVGLIQIFNIIRFEVLFNFIKYIYI